MPCLQQSYWAFFGHYGILPLFFYAFDPGMAVGWFFGLLCAAIVFTWLYNSTKGSLLAVALWHATSTILLHRRPVQGWAPLS